MHSSRMRTARSSSLPGARGLHQAPPKTKQPWTRHTPPRPGVSPGTRHPSPRPDTPGTRPPPLWTETLTHATQNITLPQTLFASGNKYVQSFRSDRMRFRTKKSTKVTVAQIRSSVLKFIYVPQWARNIPLSIS